MTLKARPWAAVMMGGEEIGETPQVISLPPGEHTVKFVRHDREVTRTFVVEADNPVEVMVDLQD